MKELNATKYTFTLLNKQELQWIVSDEEEKYSKLSNFDRRILFFRRHNINPNEVEHSHTKKRIRI